MQAFLDQLQEDQRQYQSKPVPESTMDYPKPTSFLEPHNFFLSLSTMRWHPNNEVQQIKYEF